jgi:hypothetical protein
VVQCKHYAVSGYQTLFSHLQRKEASKVKALKPTRYLLATSVGLTPGNKEDIASLFEPYCSSTGDVYGREDLNNVLGRYPQVERSNFKLWLTSTAVLQRVLQSSVFNRSDVEAEAIKRKLKYFVMTGSLAKAKSILEESHYCLITGIPGIGKTTLAEMLIVDYIAEGYEAIRVTSDIAEAYATYRPSDKQIFYYDDFLGQAGLEEKLGKNEDQNILRFIEAVRHSSNTWLILTTRDYILNQAKAIYERLGAANFDSRKFVLELSGFTELQKAEILYNHVYFSDLPEEHKADLLQDKNYLKIIRHPNYNPRIIEMMTGFAAGPEREGETYTKTFLRNLEDPSRVWEHAFSRQISEAARHLLLVLLSLPNAVHHRDLEAAFEAFYRHRAERYGFPTRPGEFLAALRELEGNFVSIVANDSERFITTHNPSIRDFLHRHVEANPTVIEHLCESAVFFQQSMRLWGTRLDVQKLSTSLHDITKQYLRAFLASLARTFESADCTPFSSGRVFIDGRAVREIIKLEERVLFTLHVAETTRSEEAYDVVRDVLPRLIRRAARGEADSDLLFKLAQELDKVSFDYGVERDSLLTVVKDALVRDLNNLDDFVQFVEFNKTFEGVVTEEEYKAVGARFEAFIEKDLPEAVSSAYTVSDDLYGYAESLRTVAGNFGHDVQNDITWLEEKASEMREKEEEEAHNEYLAEVYTENYRFSEALKREEVITGCGGSVESLFESFSDTPPAKE